MYLLTPVYTIVFFFVLMSLPSNAAETNSNSEFARFFLRQTPQAQQYYSQFANPFGQPVQYDQFGNPIPNQPQFNSGMNQGFQGQAPQGFNPNVQHGGQPQGFTPNAQHGAQAQQAPEEKQEEVVVEQQNVEVAPHVEVTPTVEEVQVETAPTVEEVASEVEATHDVKVEVAGGARSRRLQKLNKAEEEAVFKKRR